MTVFTDLWTGLVIVMVYVLEIGEDSGVLTNP